MFFILLASNRDFVTAQQTLSQRAGYNEAMLLWDIKMNTCDLKGVLMFWDQVKQDTFKLCDTKYFLNQQRIEACKEGAATFVREKADSCSTDTDCKNLGNVAAENVSIQFCNKTKAPTPTDFFPPACQRAANQQCNVEGILKVQSLANMNKCSPVKVPLTEAQNLAMQSECREYVRDWARTSLLP